MCDLSSCFSLLTFPFFVASLVYLGNEGTQSQTFIALATTWAVLTGLQFLMGLCSSSIPNDGGYNKSASIAAYSQVKFYIFLAGMILLGTQGKEDPTFQGLATALIVLCSMQFVAAVSVILLLLRGEATNQNVFLKAAFWLLLITLEEVITYCFIASMVLLGTQGKDDPLFLSLTCAWTIIMLVFLAWVCVASLLNPDDGVAIRNVCLGMGAAHFLVFGFIASMVLLSRHGRNDQAFIGVVVPWAVITLFLLTWLVLYLCGGCTLTKYARKEDMNSEYIADRDDLLEGIPTVHPGMLMNKLVWHF